MVVRYRSATLGWIESARRLRSSVTPSEKVLRAAHGRQQVGDVQFSRPCPEGWYVLAFCCPEHRLDIEVAGSVHDGTEHADAFQTEYFESFGYRVIRFRHDQIQTDLASVTHQIQTALVPSKDV